MLSQIAAIYFASSIIRNEWKKVGNYKLGRFTYNGKSKTLTDENGCGICDHVGNLMI